MTDHDLRENSASPRSTPGHDMGGLNSMAASATLHCLMGCAVGEIVGLVVGTAAGLGNGSTIAISVALAFVFGFTLSSLPLLRAGLTITATLAVVAAADTLSIATMEVFDNVVMALIPGAMDAGLVNEVFWIGMMISLTAAFVAAYPVNRWLLKRGKGHALTHEHHHAASDPTGARRLIPSFTTSTLAAALVAFMIGGLVVSVADELGKGSPSGRASSSVAGDADAGGAFDAGTHPSPDVT